MSGRRVLVHYHIYKNAGSTIDRLLSDSFGSAFATIEAADRGYCLEPGSLPRFLANNPHVQAVSSHSAHPPLPSSSALPIVLLRHPADRARSAWQFARHDPAAPDHAIARDGSFAEYVHWSLAARGHGAVLRDQQVIHLSDAAFRQGDDTLWRATQADLAQACATLDSWPAHGLVRRFAASCQLFNARYQAIFPGLRFMDIVENATADTRLDDQAAVMRARHELGEPAYTALCDANRLDLALYEHACTLFERRLREAEPPPTPRRGPVGSRASSRRVLVHYRIAQNAGATIDRLLLDSFGPAFAVHDGAAACTCIDPPTLQQAIEARPGLVAVSSRKAHPPLPDARALPIVMLRHPALRARSAYHLARRDASLPDHAVARDEDFAGYVRWSLATVGEGAVLREGQVIHLSHAAYRQTDKRLRQPTQDDLAQACAVLAAWPVFGLVGRFAQSCRLFNARYRPAYPALRFVDMVENQTAAPLEEAAAITRVRDELGEEMFGCLCEANRLDLALYDFASTLFAARSEALERPAAAIGWRLSVAAAKARGRLARPSLLTREPD